MLDYVLVYMAWTMDTDRFDRRILQAECGNSTDPTTDEKLTDSEILRSTFSIYGGLFAFVFVVFLIVRPCFPRVYNIKRTFPELHCKVAEDAYGTFSWMWRVFRIPYEDICEQCGMDAATTVRILEFGVKLAGVGMLNSCYLFPVYSTGNTLASQGKVNDPIVEISLSNVPQGDNAIIATAISAYIFFGSAMYLVLQEFRFFTTKRHRFLAQKRPDNYSIYIAHLPPKYRSDQALTGYFRDCFAHSAVLEARVALVIPELEKKVAARNALVAKLEHAINVREVKGEVPTHKTKLFGGEIVNSIEAYTLQLDKLNAEISDAITSVDMRHAAEGNVEGSDRSNVEHGELKRESEDHTVINTSVSVEVDSSPVAAAADGVGDNNPNEDEPWMDDPQRGSSAKQSNESKPLVRNIGGTIMSAATSGVKSVASSGAAATSGVRSVATSGVKSAATTGVKSVTTVTTTLKSLISNDEGGPRDAAFVSFADLTSANLALQAVHNHSPHVFDAQEPPQPQNINWKNIGLSHRRKQVGELVAFVLTVLLCIFWTIPVGFVASLSNVESLKCLLPFLETALQNNPWLSALLAQLAPLFLVGFIALLPYILLAFALLEGHISITNLQHPSLLAKLAVFTIIQTFFVSTLSGTITSQIQAIIQNPISVVERLAAALPAQASYFQQLIIVQTTLDVAVEILRVSPVGHAIARHVVGKIFGFNLTEKERNTSFLGIRSLNNPQEYYFGVHMGQKFILLFMVLFVYGSMAPLTAHICCFCFFVLAMALRHQFLYIYPPNNDSGGKLWINFMKIVVVCMIIAQVVLLGVLLLKKGFIAVPPMVLLIITTILFNVYINRKHYFVTRYLPTEDCIAADRENKQTGASFDFLSGSYLQPAMQKKVLYPENFTETKQMSEERNICVESQSMLRGRFGSSVRFSITSDGDAST